MRVWNVCTACCIAGSQTAGMVHSYSLPPCRLYVDAALDSLAHLQDQKVFTAPKGANGDPSMGSGGPR